MTYVAVSRYSLTPPARAGVAKWSPVKRDSLNRGLLHSLKNARSQRHRYNGFYMATSHSREIFTHSKVKYTLEVDGKLIVVENVPARVCVETGEQLFAPETVERLQKLVAGKTKPKRVMEVPVFEFA